MADGVLIQYVAPGSFIKNAAALAVVYVVATNGLRYALGLLRAGGFPAVGVPFGAGASVLNLVIGIGSAVLGVCLAVVVFNWLAGQGDGFPLRFRAPAPWTSGTRELRRMSPGSAMCTGALAGAFLGLLLGLCALVLLGGLAGALGGGTGWQVGALAAGMLLGVPVGMGVWTGLVALGLSALYNVLAPAWGGIQFQSAIASTAVAEYGVRPAERSARVSGIGVWQTGVIGAAEALVVSVFAIVLVLLPMSRLTPSPGLGPMTAAGSVVTVVVMLVVYPVLGFISGVVTALVYNLAGLVAGGVEIEAVG